MSTRARRAKSAGPGALPPPATAATPRARRLPRATLAAVSHSSSPRLAPNLPSTPDRGGSWRSSIMAAPTNASALLDERQSFVSGPALAALDELISVGKDEEGEGAYGALQLTQKASNTYAAFEGCKKAFLSSATFLSASDLASKNPEAVADPSSPLSTLIKVANLTTFLFLIFSSAPTPDGSRPREANARLREAAGAFLKFIVPVDSQLHDGALRMLVGLNCQAYLSASAHSPKSPPDAADFFAHQLSSYYPMGTTLNSRDPLANRESSIRFNQYNTSAMALIDQVGGDVAVLETQWKWEDLALELRNYCESIARRLSGTQSASQELLVSGLSESEPEVVSRAPLSSAKSKGKQRAVVQDESSQDDLESSSDEETDMFTQAPRAEVDQDLANHEEGDLEVDERQEGDYDGEETASEAEDRRDQDRKVEASETGTGTETSDSEEEEEEVAVSLGAVSPRSIRQSMSASVVGSSPVRRSSTIRQESIQLETYAAEDDPEAGNRRAALLAFQEESYDSQSQSLSEGAEDEGDATMRAPEVAEGENEDEPETVPLLENNAALYRAALAAEESSADEEETESLSLQAPVESRTAEFLALQADVEADTDDEAAPVVSQTDAAAAVVATGPSSSAPVQMKVGFSKDNRLVRKPAVPRAGPSMLERQPDAERLTFNSQGDDSPAPPPKRGRGRPGKLTGQTASAASVPRPSSSIPAPRPSSSAVASASKRTSTFVGVEIPVLRQPPRRVTRSASVEVRLPSPPPIAVKTKAAGASRSKSNALEVPVEVGRSTRLRSKTRSPSQQSVIEEEEPIGEGRVDDDGPGLGRFEFETVEHNPADFFGEADEQQEPIEQDILQEEREEGQDFALEVKAAARRSKKDKGKGKARQAELETNRLALESASDDDTQARQMALDLLASADESSNPKEPSASAEPASARRSIHTAQPIPPSSPILAAGPSSARRKSAPLKRRDLNRFESDGPAFRTDSESDDEQVAAANRKRRRREPEQEDDEARRFDDEPRKKRRGSSGRKDRDEDEDLAAEFLENRSARKKKPQKWPSSSPRKGGSKKRKLEKSRRRQRYTSESSSDDVAASDDSSIPARRPTKNNLYFTGRNVTGRQAWSDLEERTLLRCLSELGPSYATIHALHGPDGTTSRILKRRNIVSLKDKAVNVKIRLVRSGQRLPPFLETITVPRIRWGARGPPVALDEHSDDLYVSDGVDQPEAAAGSEDEQIDR